MFRNGSSIEPFIRGHEEGLSWRGGVVKYCIWYAMPEELPRDIYELIVVGYACVLRVIP